MSDPREPSGTRPVPIRENIPAPRTGGGAVVCERCGTEMFRMHAVWRCPSCGFKTDCCGW